MKILIKVLAFTLASLTTTSIALAEEANSQTSPGFIIDELTIFMHAGPGTNYRILGSINAGSEIQVTGNSDKGYSEIIDNKNRTTWVQSKYITDKPGLRYVVAELNGKIASSTDFTSQLDGEVNALKAKVAELEKNNSELTKEASQLNKALTSTQSKLKDQDTNIQKQWFFNGAMVLGVGLLLGLILPKFFARRRSSMDSWQ